MEVYVTEEQQVEAIKKWFNKYGNMLSWVVIVVSLTASGIMYWRHHQQVLEDAASDQYLALLEGVEKKDKATIDSKAQVLLAEYASSPYASLASFVLANESVDENKFDIAEKHLQWVMSHSKQANFQAIATIRLMRLLISQNKLDEALKLYNDKNMGPYLTLIAELKGDILVKQKKLDAAKTAYELALNAAPEEGMHGPLLKMKMQELGLESTAKDVKADEASTS
ncbi:MAG: tetratricopeptide repeat protein [Proteobacteria bacterium]|nr:tetratricopeptide repeat protein [Pseudomonadota bacterium]